MRIQTLFAVAAFLLGFSTLPAPSSAGTIAPGQVRVVEGKITAVDVAYRAVVMDVATAKGPMTVGVTLDESVTPTSDGTSVLLRDIAVGERAVLKYTRQDGRLVGLELRIRR